MCDEQETVTIRPATLDDSTTIAEHRARLFQDTGRVDAERATAMIGEVAPTLRQMLSTGEYLGWLAVTTDAAVVAGAGVQLRRLLPRPETSVAYEALVVNVYVHPAHRRRGLARSLMSAVLAWCREQGIERVVLHASNMGRPLYETLGFTLSNEMVLYLR
jgi:GNAT superfamily N-acetyltransferase